MRIGIDLGGTKTDYRTERAGGAAFPSPPAHAATIITRLSRRLPGWLEMAEQATGQTGSVGMGIPGSISPYTGVVKTPTPLAQWPAFDKDF